MPAAHFRLAHWLAIFIIMHFLFLLNWWVKGVTVKGRCKGILPSLLFIFSYILFTFKKFTLFSTKILLIKHRT